MIFVVDGASLTEKEARDEVLRSYEIPEEALDGCKLLYVYYSYENYSGYSDVIFEKDGELFHVSGGHCSCYGLEGQWKPDPTSIDALRNYRTREPSFLKFLDSYSAF